jgi:hypothetical protein
MKQVGRGSYGMRARSVNIVHKLLIPALLLMVASATDLGSSGRVEWKVLAPGLELTAFKAVHAAAVGDSKITVLRIDPALWDLEFAGSSQSAGAEEHTAKEWSVGRHFVAVINAGMFRASGESHVGYLRYQDQLYSKTITSYLSLAAFGPEDGKLPRFRIFDVESPRDIPNIAKGYKLAVQNLRLIEHPGANKWGKQGRKWSEAALGEDRSGHILFIFARAPFSMYEINEELLAARVGVVAAQHLEGGPEAQLYIHAGGTELEMFGSYETAFEETDANSRPWPIPNVLAIRPRKDR